MNDKGAVMGRRDGALQQRSMCHCFGCGIESAPGGIRRLREALPPIGNGLDHSPSAPFLGTAPAGDAAMDNPKQTLREALEIAGKKSETTLVKSAQPEVAHVID